METTMADMELEEKMVNDEFQSLIDAYLASKHRKKVDKFKLILNFRRELCYRCSCLFLLDLSFKSHSIFHK